MQEMGSTPGLGRSPGKGNDNPLQYSCLESFMDRGAWWTIVLIVTKSQKLLRMCTYTHTHTQTHTHTDTHTHRHTHIPGIYSRISKPTQIQWSRGSERDSQRSAFPRKTPLLILNNLNSSATWQLISLNYKLRRLFRKGISQRLGLCHSAELYPRSPQQHCHILGTQYMCLLDEWVNGRMKEGIPRQPGNLMF